ncbi:MAG: ABC transporter permease subunit [Candidatus Dormibacteraeota bacterium]|nr:ABC transporter permease subunit [Candidatus Dormibacteraeota bacterium]
MSQAETTASIHDIGYRHYEGPRLGRRYAVLSLYLHGLRGTFGLGRAARYKVVPFILLGITAAPAVISAAIAALTPFQPIAYTSYTYYLQLPIMLFVAAQAPQLVSGDTRSRVLSLYFSRPLERSDYVWARLAGLATALLLVMALPLAILYVAALLGHVHSPTDAWDESRRFLVGVGGIAVQAVVLASLGLAIACLTRIRVFAVAAVIGVYLVSDGVVSTILGVTRGGAVAAAFFTPFQLQDWFQAWALRVSPVLPPGPGQAGPLFGLGVVVLVAACVGVLLLRYRSAES